MLKVAVLEPVLAKVTAEQVVLVVVLLIQQVLAELQLQDKVMLAVAVGQAHLLILQVAVAELGPQVVLEHLASVQVLVEMVWHLL
jgi:hypothetical protein